MFYSFFALISRMKNIDRWALMRNTKRENIQEHSHMVAVLAHGLAVIRRDVMGKDCSPEAAAAAALFHDAPEILTGDMPTPVKYYNKDMINAYRRVEERAICKLAWSIPREIRPEYNKLLRGNPEVDDLVRAADKLSAYIKCLEELKSGNEEFRTAARLTLLKLKEMNMPEVEYFMENFIPAFEMTLDELDI